MWQLYFNTLTQAGSMGLVYSKRYKGDEVRIFVNTWFHNMTEIANELNDYYFNVLSYLMKHD